ncbi:MAG: hypothetical protein WBF33_18750 [Candidatus Nitrosopolaris sp.]
MTIKIFVYHLLLSQLDCLTNCRSTLPIVEKKLRVIVDWFIDLFFKRDVTRLKTLTLKRSIEDRAMQTKQTEASR